MATLTTSLRESVAEFRAAMERAGIRVEAEIIPDGRLHRVHAERDRPQSKNAWYVLHLDVRPVGRFGSWRLGTAESWVSAQAQHLTEAEREEQERQIAARVESREAERIRLEAQAKRRAQYIWERSRPAGADHPYLKAKGVGAHGLRLHKGLLVVPLYDNQTILHSLQFIGPDGQKRFLSHGRVEGCFCGLGRAEPGARLWIAEGFATGATVHEVVGGPVAVAFNAGNLKLVALALRERLPNAALVIAADNDAWTKGNPGLAKGIEAARCVGARLAVPCFADASTRPTDWNDMCRLRGAAETKLRLLRAV